ADAHFVMAAESDVRCPMAYWGIAMTQLHPLWGPSTDAELLRGREAAREARRLKPPTEREAAYVAAMEGVFMPESATFAERLASWEMGMKAVHDVAPDDVEASAFYALSRLATAPKNDKTFAANAEVG